MASQVTSPASVRLEIAPVIAHAEEIAQTVTRELPGHEGLSRAARGVASAGRSAERVARALQRPLGLHRLPAAFLAIALLGFLFWAHRQFFHTATLTIALPDR